MNLLLTGASSFVGAHVAQHLAKRHKVFGCYFSTPLRYAGVLPLRIDLRKSLAVQQLQKYPIDVVVHIACKIKGRPKENETPAQAAYRENTALMNSVLALGKPIIYASSTVVHWQRDIPYVQSRREDEQRLQMSGLPHAILRPSAPYGPRLLQHSPRHQESFHTLAQWVRYSPLVPRIGSGDYRRQPVHIDDFASAILSLLEQDLPNQAYDVGGMKAYSFNEIINIIGDVCHKTPRPFTIPKWGMVKLAAYLKDFDPTLIDAVDEDELADPTALTALTQVSFRSFQEGAPDLFR